MLAVACALLLACDRPPSDELAPQAPSLQRLPDEYEDGRLVLGSDSLFAGIPGSGPVALDQIRAWLDDPANHQPLDFILPVGLREAADLVEIPADNPLTRAKIELGRQLFFDRRLSHPEKNIACFDCHPPAMNYSFGHVFHPNRPHERAAPVVFNRILSRHQFWDGRAASLEEQAWVPILAEHEMGNTEPACLATLNKVEGYRIQFDRIFGGVSRKAVGQALASFERALVTRPSAFDYARNLRNLEAKLTEAGYTNDRAEAAQLQRARELAARHSMSQAAVGGEQLFYSDRLGCGACHTGPNLTDEQFHNVGVGMDEAAPDWGRFLVTHRDEDRGAFKTPTLRNVVHTAGYMHREQLTHLDDVISWFARGGLRNPYLSPKIRPFELTQSEQHDLLEFLKACSSELPKVEMHRLPP